MEIKKKNSKSSRCSSCSGVLIFNYSDYVTKMFVILNDGKRFLNLADISFDDTCKAELNFKKRLLEFYKSKFISKKPGYDRIRLVHCQCPGMYGLSKFLTLGWPKYRFRHIQIFNKLL